MPKITILWGEAPEAGDTAKTYEFPTQVELDAFLQGVDATEGWMGWHKVKEGYVVPEEGFDGDPAVDDDEEEEPDTQTYKVRLMVTGRLHAEDTFEAVDDEAAKAYVKALDPDDFIYSYSSDDSREGDEIAYWSLEDSETLDEEEVVLMKEGEPFSWDACNIVKDLAKLFNQRITGPEEGSHYSEVMMLIRRAHDACTRQPTGMQEG
jgi:hypothetical protein